LSMCYNFITFILLTHSTSPENYETIWWMHTRWWQASNLSNYSCHLW